MRNFNYPYFSRDIAEFWRRWHISLSTWFRDYVYFPLGGSKVSNSRSMFNIFVVFLLSGLWHGANWTYIVWGLLNAFYFLPLFVLGTNRRFTEEISPGRILPTASDMLRISITFLMTCFAWIFFRAKSLSDAIGYIEQIGTLSISMPDLQIIGELMILLPLLTGFILIEWICRNHHYPFEATKANQLKKWSYYLITGLLILGSGHLQATFIYFQF
jgi:alginate O-acetyltransferase complex protein AlgI